MTDLDSLDFEILRHLQEDGRRSFTEIADDLKVSAGTIRNRFAKLLADKALHVIGRADPHRVGFRAPANVHILIRPPHLIETTAAAIAEFPEVSYVAIVSGEFDLEVDIMCRDLDHLTDLVTQRLPQVHGVTDIRTNVILRVIKYAQPDLRILQEERVGSRERGAENEGREHAERAAPAAGTESVP
jgi:Lrp/AsnC family transcriptional regulator for asnA, asnC and gidA